MMPACPRLSCPAQRNRTDTQHMHREMQIERRRYRSHGLIIAHENKARGCQRAADAKTRTNHTKGYTTQRKTSKKELVTYLVLESARQHVRNRLHPTVWVRRKAGRGGNPELVEQQERVKVWQGMGANTSPHPCAIPLRLLPRHHHSGNGPPGTRRGRCRRHSDW